MEASNIRVVATPEAYEVIMNSHTSGNQQVLAYVRAFVFGGHEILDGMLFADSKLYLRVRWPSPQQPETIIIISHTLIIDDFEDTIENSFPVPLV